MLKSWVLGAVALVAIFALVLGGCGVGGSSSPVASALNAVSGHGALHGPPATWLGHPPLHVRRKGSKGHGGGGGPPVIAGYSPTQIRDAYGFNLISGDGSGQTIAIVDAYGSPTIQSDLNTFCSQFNMSSTTVNVLYPQGKPRKTDAGWALETSLDVEWAHAIAPGATILLVVAKSASFSNLLAAVNTAVANHATEVSMSWGGNEFSGETGYDAYFNQGSVSFTASSGDSGGGAQWPAASPYVIAVGGTTLTLDSAGNVSSETAWSGSNGGPSAYETEPSYQSAWQSSGKREMPDVSYVADPNTGLPVYDSTSYQGTKGWFEVGGTSVGAPQWAALIALVKASGASSDPLNSGLYTAAGSPTSYNSTDYRDITQGSNGSYSAGSGYDMVTGLGSPLANGLLTTLTGQNPPS